MKLSTKNVTFEHLDKSVKEANQTSSSVTAVGDCNIIIYPALAYCRFVTASRRHRFICIKCCSTYKYFITLTAEAGSPENQLKLKFDASCSGIEVE